MTFLVDLFCLSRKIKSRNMSKSYHEFTNKEEANTFLKENYQKYCQDYKEKKIAMERYGYDYRNHLLHFYADAYLGNMYAVINEYMRTGNLEDQEYSRTLDPVIDRLNELIILGPRIPKDIVVYRGVSDKTMKMMLSEQKSHYNTYYDKGFMSTTLLLQALVDESERHYENILKIYVPKGAFALGVSCITDRDEYEILFPGGQYLTFIKKCYCKEYNKNIYEYELKVMHCL